jgi:hypothetical protein
MFTFPLMVADPNMFSPCAQFDNMLSSWVCGGGMHGIHIHWPSVPEFLVDAFRAKGITYKKNIALLSINCLFNIVSNVSFMATVDCIFQNDLLLL